MDNLRLFQKYLSIVSLAKAPTGSYTNKIDYRCLKCTTHSSIDSCWYWKTCLNWVVGSLASEFTWNWPCSWPLKNDFRANLMAFCRFLSVYLLGRLGIEAGAEVGVRETASVSLRVPLLLVGAPPALRRLWGPATWLAKWISFESDYKLLFFRMGWLICWVWSF